MRDKLSESIKEFDAVLKPDGRVVYLEPPVRTIHLQRAAPAWIRDPYNPLESLLKQQKKMEDTWLQWSSVSQGILRTITANLQIPSDSTSMTCWNVRLPTVARGLPPVHAGYEPSDQSRYPLKLSDLVVMHLNPGQPRRKPSGLLP